MENNNQIVPGISTIDVSKGYAALYLLFHKESFIGNTVTIQQKDIESTCYQNPESSAEVSFKVEVHHPKIFNHVGSPITDKLETGKYHRFFVKKGFKYEVELQCQQGYKKSCITFDENKEEFFQQFF